MKNFTVTQLNDFFLVALQASVRASEEIMSIYETSFEEHIKIDGTPVTNADTASSKIIVELLKTTGIPIISEEEIKLDFEERQHWQSVWIVDPLDGTKEFIKKNGEFAVNIALVENGKAIFGIIASPVKRKILFGGKKIGVFIADFENANQTEKWVEIRKNQQNSTISVISSRAAVNEKEQIFIDQLKTKNAEIQLIRKGSALKFFDLVNGVADVYPRFAPTMEWDIAAGQAILEALGGQVVDYQTGKPLEYNKKSLYNPHFVAKTERFINFER